MTPDSISFSSIEAVCAYIRKTGLQNYLLLAKKKILIARYTAAELCLAREQFGASVVKTTETAGLLNLCFSRNSSFFRADRRR